MTREECIEILDKFAHHSRSEVIEYPRKVAIEALEMAIEALKAEPCEDKGEISDGYHTFNQLYHQRAVLFATIVNQNKSRSWKSYKHSDGQYCFDSNGEWFIVGIDTPQGTYTYHYSKEYWNMFDCQELECGKEWDGHTEEDVIRLLSLQQEPCEEFVKWVATEIFDDMWEYNKDAFAEIACRKLAKLGIVIRMGDEWVLVDEEGENE